MSSTDDEFVLFPEAPHLPPVAIGDRASDAWLSRHDEGKLAVDVHEIENEIVVRSAIAGVRPEDLEVHVHNDLLTVRGKRLNEEETVQGKSLIRECHWGSFSRSIILPSEIDPDGISAVLKDGVLTIRVPKAERTKKISVKEA